MSRRTSFVLLPWIVSLGWASGACSLLSEKAFSADAAPGSSDESRGSGAREHPTLAVGPSEGARTTYRLRLEESGGGRDRTRELTLEVLRFRGDSPLALLRWIPAPDSTREGSRDRSAATVPAATFVPLSTGGRVLDDQRGFVEPILSDAIHLLFASLELPRVEEGTAWTEEVETSLFLLPVRIELERVVGRARSASGAGEELGTIASHLTRPRELAFIGSTITLEEWRHEWRFTSSDEPVLESGSTTLRFTSEETTSGVSRRITRRVELERIARESLPEEEMRALESEARELREIDDLLKGRSRGGFLGALFGAKKPTVEDLRERIADFGREHPEPRLRAVYDSLRDAVEKKGASQEKARRRHELEQSIVGEIAPDFELEDLGGESVSLADFRGRVVLLSFWGVGCGPCRAEAPYLTEWQRKYEKDGLTVVAVNAYDEAKETVAKFARTNELGHRILLRGGAIAGDKYFVSGYPTSFLIDREGRVVARDVGFAAELSAAYEEKIRGVLAKAEELEEEGETRGEPRTGPE